MFIVFGVSVQEKMHEKVAVHLELINGNVTLPRLGM